MLGLENAHSAKQCHFVGGAGKQAGGPERKVHVAFRKRREEAIDINVVALSR